MFTTAEKKTDDVELGKAEQGSEKLTIDLNYEYEDGDVLGILKVGLQELNALPCFVPDYPVSNAAVSLKQYLSNERIAHAKLGERLLLIPYNIGGYHWVGISIHINHLNCINEIVVIDSLISDIHSRNIRQALRETVSIYPELAKHPIKEKFGWVQEDSVSCGPLAVENLLTIANQHLLIPRIATREDLIEIRLKHVNLYKNYCSDFYKRQKYNVNSVASLQQQHQWLREAGSHFNAHEIRKITKAIQFIQGIGNLAIRGEVIKALRPNNDEQHKQHLDRLRSSLFKVSREIQNVQDKENFNGLLKELFDIQSNASDEINFENRDLKLPYEAIKLIVKSVDVKAEELDSIARNILTQIRDEEKFSKELESKLKNEKNPDSEKGNHEGNIFKRVGRRLFKSNNRSLGTVFGCIGGLIVGIILVGEHKISIAIIGAPNSIAWDIVTILLSAGTGGNLSSYVGATIDILAGEKTIFDYMGNWCKRKAEANRIEPGIEVTDRHGLKLQTPQHAHFPVITSAENEAKKNLSKDPEERILLFDYQRDSEDESAMPSREDLQLEKQSEELADKTRFKVDKAQKMTG